MTQDEYLKAMDDEIRLFMRDDPKLNKLIRGVEHTPERREHAVRDALDWFNETVPLTSFTLTNVPFPRHMKQAVVLELLDSLYLLLERNDKSIRDQGGVAVTKRQVERLAQRLARERALLEQRVQRAKAAYNLKRAMGSAEGVSSVYNTEYY